MSLTIKEIRNSTGLTQMAFSKKFDIPLSTLRKWEQGETKPAPYIIKMLSQLLPLSEEYAETITTTDGAKYYYDSNTNEIIDSKGNAVHISVSLKGVKRENLPLYVKDMFDSYYEIINKFEKDCEFDKNEDIIWS